MNGTELLNERVRFVTGQGSPAFDALVVGYTDAPTYTVIRDNGDSGSWRADLVGRVLTCQTCRAFHDLFSDLGEAARDAIAIRWRDHREDCPDQVIQP